MRHVSFLQVLFVGLCFVAIGLAHRAGPYEGTLVSVAVGLILWLKQPPSGPMPPAVGKALACALLGFGVSQIAACASSNLTPKDATELVEEGGGLTHCMQTEREAVEAGYDGSPITVFDNCVKDGGL